MIEKEKERVLKEFKGAINKAIKEESQGQLGFPLGYRKGLLLSYGLLEKVLDGI